MRDQPPLTVAAATAVFQVEKRTLQRLLATGQLNGAYKNPRGHWMIPVNALHATGFAARQTWISDATEHDTDTTQAQKSLSNQSKTITTSNATEHDADATALRQHIARLHEQLDAEKRLREAAERNANDLRTAMRMIEAGQTQPVYSKPSLRRWWQRK